MTLAGTVSAAAGLTNTGHETPSGTITVDASLSNSGTTVVTGNVNLLGGTIVATGTIDIYGGRLGTASTRLGVRQPGLHPGECLPVAARRPRRHRRFGTGASTLALQDETGIVTAQIQNFGAGDRVEIASVDITGDTVIANGNNSYAVTVDADP